jgi:predicted RNA-binding protein with PIN domain
MGLLRILVDGYSLLHHWPELAPNAPRHSEAARDELVRTLRLYRDAVRTPMTIVFDGGGAPKDIAKPDSTRELEVLFSGKGKTADDLIERATYRLREYGDVLVVTNDFAERNTVEGFGALTSSCEHFIEEIERVISNLSKEIRSRNRSEKEKYQRKRNQ